MRRFIYERSVTNIRDWSLAYSFIYVYIGNFSCVVCGIAHFSSTTKYDSGSGWPSFWDLVDKNNVRCRSDASAGTHMGSKWRNIKMADCSIEMSANDPSSKLSFCSFKIKNTSLKHTIQSVEKKNKLTFLSCLLSICFYNYFLIDSSWW